MTRPRTTGDGSGVVDFGRRADAADDRFVASHVTPAGADNFVALDGDIGAYDTDTNELAAVHQLVARRPEVNGRVWVVRVVKRYAHMLRSPRRLAGD